MVKITDVLPCSSAAAHGVRPGDVLIAVNNHEIHDVLDYRFFLSERAVSLKLCRDGETFSVLIHKKDEDDIGLDFETPLMDKKLTCRNKCIFCFIDQNPKGMRDTIYFKDDDSRLSFLHGNYVTLTNMSEEDVDRIIRMHMSPINISVHTTNPELRVFMMKNKNAGRVLSYLDKFRDAGLSMCGQIVLCRGVNDGEELLRTMRDLSGYAPAMGSVSVVPAGLTEHREGLYPLTDFSPGEAARVIDEVTAFGDRMYREHGTRIFYLADEFYLKAGRPVPGADYYEEYSQLENGVGMLRSFSDDFHMALRDIKEEYPTIGKTRTVSVATGVASYPMFVSLSEELMREYPDLRINIYKIINNFFGKSITVAGLLTGRDMLEPLRGQDLGEELLISQSTLRAGEDVFLCGMTKDELSAGLGVPVRAAENDGYAFVYALLGVAEC